MSILEYKPLPGITYRDCQVEVLQWLERNWNHANTFLIKAPVASGKSIIAATIAKWLKEHHELRSDIITPQVMLQEQYKDTFRDLKLLKGKSRYSCDVYGDCETGNLALGKKSYCPGCPYREAKKAVQENYPGVFNFHSFYLMRDLKTDCTIVDEAHGVISALTDFYSLNIWWHDYQFPALETHADVYDALHGYKAHIRKLTTGKAADDAKVLQRIQKIDAVILAFKKTHSEFIFQVCLEMYRGRKSKVLKIIPRSLRRFTDDLWRSPKIVLLSGTFNHIDLRKLGLEVRRTASIEVTSPILPERRPFVQDYRYQMMRQNTGDCLKILAEYIKEIAAKHPKQKGMVHIPYNLGPRLKKLLPQGSLGRVEYHDKRTKAKKLENFLKTDHPQILIAHGLSEGLDLAGPEYGFQIIGKVPRQSLGDPLVAEEAKRDSEAYTWQTLKTIVQQYGRICRGPDDYGVTYMVDGTFERDLRQGWDLLPEYFQQVVKKPSSSWPVRRLSKGTKQGGPKYRQKT